MLLAGCASIPDHTPLTHGLHLDLVGRVDQNSPLAWRHDAESIAYVRGKLVIAHLATGERTMIDAAPSAIAWSPDGAMLATAAAQGESTVLHIYDMRGTVMDETVVPGHVAKISWRPGSDLMAATLSLERFSFGSNLRVQLQRWNRGAPPSATVLSDVTIMPARAHRQLQNYLDSFSFDLSPFTDEIAFTRFVEPPNFPSYMKVVVRHLGSGAEKETPGVKNDAAGVVFSADGEHLVYGDGAGTIKELAHWTGAVRDILPTPGRTLALSPSDRYLFADGRLYLDGIEIAAFPPECDAAFAPDGSKLLLRCGESLSLLSGLSQSPPPVVAPAAREALLNLRKWRSEGLVSDQEYQTSKQRILAQ